MNAVIMNRPVFC